MDICELHLQTMQTMDRIEKKLDDQDRQRECLTNDIRKVQSTIENGLRSEVQDINIGMLELSRKFDLTISGIKNSILDIEKITDKITEFNWFREFATEFRNKLFVNTLKIIFMGVILLVIMHFGSSMIVQVFKG